MLFLHRPSFLLGLCLSGRTILCANNASSAAPISFSPSLYWDGIDGAWSTFTLQIGTTPQAVRLLPSMTGNTIWAVLPQACPKSMSSSCATDRGGVFAINESTTWDDQGLYQLPLQPQHYLPFTGTANFGFDNVTLEWQGFGGIELSHQVVAGYVTEDFYVGALGLSPLSVNITSFNDQYPSFLGALRAGNHIPSHSFGYTAGASYRSFPENAFGSLILGGYDSTRLDLSNNLTISGGYDTYRPMLLGIEKITSGSNELLDAPIITALDSVVSHIWLPISACQHFESVFGIIWDATHELYIVNETEHAALLAQDAAITFTLSSGSEQDKESRLNITFPYAAFDLTAKPPFTGLNETVRYFPLKRAANDTQYTLGRTFLQEMYVVMDYDRDELALFRAVFPDSSIKPHLVAIESPANAPAVTTTEVKSKIGLSKTAIIGIAVGGVLLSLFLAAGSLYYYLYRKRHGRKPNVAIETSNPERAAEIDNQQTYRGGELGSPSTSDRMHELASPIDKRHELASAVDAKHELASSVDIKHELASPADMEFEMPSIHDLKERKEPQMSSVTSSSLPEMPSDHDVSELLIKQEIHEMP